MSFFDEVETTVANTRLLQAERGRGEVRLNLRPFKELGKFADDYRNRLTIKTLLIRKTFGHRIFKQYLKDIISSGQRKAWPVAWVLGLLEAIGNCEAAPFESRSQKVSKICNEFLQETADDNQEDQEKSADPSGVQVDVHESESSEEDPPKEQEGESKQEDDKPEASKQTVVRSAKDGVHEGIAFLGEACCSSAVAALEGGIHQDEVPISRPLLLLLMMWFLLGPLLITCLTRFFKLFLHVWGKF